jgi:exodeoxyribonuclease VII large subunit
MIKTVKELTYWIKILLETDPELQNLSVEGEISNITKHRSGHVYFTLKDEEAQLSAVWFRAPILRFEEGDKVLAMGRINLYPPHGRYQLVVESLQPRGQGLLYRRFIELKERLQNEGLFDPAHKKPIPRMPKVIGVISSPTGAVIQDIIKTLKRRYPYTKILLLPATVQGENATPSLLQAFAWVEALPEIEVVILARGGGSFEDLWCFNSPELAYAIYQCTRPVVTAIGHETDTTIADMVADLRAPTPTAAAELVSRDCEEMKATLQALSNRLQRRIRDQIYYQYQRLDDYRQKLSLRLKLAVNVPQNKLTRLKLQLISAMRRRLQEQYFTLKSQRAQLNRALQRLVWEQRNRLALLHASLEKYNVEILLQKGYSLTLKNGKIIEDPAKILPGDKLETLIAEYQILSKVEEVKKRNL